jgi:hypothetical protein
VLLAGRGGEGVTSLLLVLLAGACREGAWGAVLGLACLGAAAAQEFGVALDRLVVVRRPGPQWSTAAAAALDAFDVVALCTPGAVPAAVARRLSARARAQGAVLVVLVGEGSARRGGSGELPGRPRAVPSERGSPLWPGSIDLVLSVETLGWTGIGHGFGRLTGRLVLAEARHRGTAERPRRCELWLPAPDGAVRPLSSASALRGTRAAGSDASGSPEHDADLATAVGAR